MTFLTPIIYDFLKTSTVFSLFLPVFTVWNLIAEATEHKGLFELNVSQKLLKVAEVHKVKYKAECIHVWHNRMGHRDQQAIRLLERQIKHLELTQSHVNSQQYVNAAYSLI